MRKERTAAAAEPAFDFDLGPLSWVQAEIDQALSRGLDALATFAAQRDMTSLKHARTHVHQAAGAIQMVGLDAVVAFTDEIERHLTRLEDLPEQAVAEAVLLVDRACRKLRIFLDELVNGAMPVPLKLYPEYESMQRARGVRAVAPTDLFYPDLSAKAPRIPPREAMPQNKLPSHLIKQRRLYQRGLLAWLRGDEKGAVVMRDAIAGIEDVTQQQSLRSFWWTVGALLESVTEHGVEGGFGVKQLLARIDLQIRRIAEGGAKVADRLRREVLYYAAISAPVGPQVHAVQRAFHLAGLIPTAETIETDVVGLQPLIREAREQLAGAKDTWLKFASGRAENLPKLKATLTSVHTKAAKMKQGALMKLTAMLVERLDKMPSSGVSEPVAMEYATGLLLAESAFENHANLASDFPQQVDQIIGRLDAARAGRTPPGGDMPMLDEMSKRAQERVLLAQVGREIQANLRHMEQVLDAFFRDNGKRADLSTLTKDSQQIRGALTILGLSEAERLLGLCQVQIEAYADPATAVNNDDLELLAESLSGLGFYIEAVEQQRPDRERLIAPLIAKRLGEVAAPVVEQRDSVEDAVAELRGELPALVEEMHRSPADEAVRTGLRKKLTSLRDDAELIGDGFLVDQADAAVKELDTGGTANLTAVVDAIADTNAPAPEISDETQRLLEVDAKGLDAELVEIYLTEAVEVLDAIRTSGEALAQNAGDREALATIRRGFHTLKGSGRMVGLNELGEFAYDAEKLHNRLLEEERPVTAAVLRMIRVAHDTFREWVDALREKGRVTPDPKGLHEAIRAVEAELPGRDSVIGSLPKSVLPDAAPPAPVLTIVPSHPAAPPPGERRNAAESGPSIAAPALTRVSFDFTELPELGAAAPRASNVDVVAIDGEESETDPHPVTPRTLDHALDAPDFPSLDAPLFIGIPTLKLVADNARPVSSIAPPEPPMLTVAPSAEAEAGADDVEVGGVVLSAALWRILADEAGQHLATLEHELSILQFDPQQVPSAAMIRASHTLCGIHRTGGFQLIAAQAKALELTLIALAQRGGPMPAVAQPVLARAVAGLRHFVGCVQRREAFHAYDEVEAKAIAAELDDLRSQAMSGEAIDAETAAAEQAARDEELAKGSFSGPEPAFLTVPAATEEGSIPSLVLLETEAMPDGVPHSGRVAEFVSETVHDPLAGIHDEIEDETVLMIFLEEAFELLPQAGEALRTWRRAPDDNAAARQLQRTLHTLKGSARMAGALRLGELTHLMESRLIEGDDLAPATPERFDALDADLDRVAYVLDKLRAGETEVAPAQPARHPESHQIIPDALDLSPEPSHSPPDPVVSDDARVVAAAFGEPTAPQIESAARSLEAFAAPIDFAAAPVSMPLEAALVAAEPLEAAHRDAAPEELSRVDAPPDAAAPIDVAAAPGDVAAAPVESASVESVLVETASVETPSVETAPTGAGPESAAPPVVAPDASGFASLDAATADVVAPSQIAPVALATPDAPALEDVLAMAPAPVERIAVPAQALPPASAVADVDAGPKAMLRVRADTIDRLVNEAGEVAIARARVEGELRALKTNLLELTGSVIRLRSQVREIEIQADSQIQSHLTQLADQPDFDPLEFDRFTRFQELTRSLAEGINDVSTVQQSLLKNLDDADAALLAQARLSREVQQKLFAIRTAPFGSLAERLYRIVRSVGKELGKRANLEIIGGQTELDRSVLEKLVGPLEHLLRNSLDHGLETREARRAAGKAEQGEITLKVRQAGNEIAIELADDGAGIDLERVREKASAQALFPGAGQATDAQLLESIFAPGFSTATKVTAISGRGVGLDVVRADITALGGRVDVASERSRGTRFTLSLPLTLAVAQAVLVRAGGRLWALPAPMVEQVQQVREQALMDLYVKGEVEWKGKQYPFHYLPRLLGDLSRHPETKRYNAVLLLKTGQGLAAIHVDEMIGNQEIVVKNIGPQLARVSGISGATVLGTGEIVLIIHPVQLAQRAAIPSFDPNAEAKVAAGDASAGLSGPPLVLVVDDSLTVRKITSRLLSREGFAVVTARDGIDALQVLAEHTPDVILLDIEMPRMDGFEFTKTLRNDAKHAHIPIIMITSRTADKHRARAAELGVDLYLGKPYQEEELLRNLREMLSVAAST